MESIKSSENNKENDIDINDEFIRWIDSAIQSNTCLEEFKRLFEEEVSSIEQGRNEAENGFLNSQNGKNEDDEIKNGRFNEPGDSDNNHQKMMAVTKSKLLDEAGNINKKNYNLRRYALLNNTMHKFSARI